MPIEVANTWVCNPYVQRIQGCWAVATRQALDDGSMLSIESTSNQVNQFGGGMEISEAQEVKHSALTIFSITYEVPRAVCEGKARDLGRFSELRLRMHLL